MKCELEIQAFRKNAGRLTTPTLLDFLLSTTYLISYNGAHLVFYNDVSFRETALPVHHRILHTITIAKQKQL